MKKVSQNCRKKEKKNNNIHTEQKKKRKKQYNFGIITSHTCSCSFSDNFFNILALRSMISFSPESSPKILDYIKIEKIILKYRKQNNRKMDEKIIRNYAIICRRRINSTVSLTMLESAKNINSYNKKVEFSSLLFSSFLFVLILSHLQYYSMILNDVF